MKITALSLIVVIALFLAQTNALAADVYVAVDAANVREGSGLEYPLVGSASRGQRLQLLREEWGWSNVRLPRGAEGWIYSPLLSATPPPEPVRDVNERARRYMEAGNEYFSKGLYEEGIRQYRKALPLAGDKADIHYNIANSYYQEGLSTKAEKEYLKVLDIKPDHRQARNNLALTYFEQGKYKRAVEEWEKALESAPEHLEANYNLAQGYEKVDMDSAVRQWQRYLELAGGLEEEARFVSKVKEHLERLQED